jgi:thymidine kinase
MKVGKLTVNVGSMFSGKSSELLRQGQRHVLAGRSVLYIKPAADDRYSETEIVTHDGKRIPAISLPAGELMLDHSRADVVLIDEAQFFGDRLVGDVDLLLYIGIDVIVSGLDMDRFGVPFGVMARLMAVAEEVNKLKAVCTDCGSDAWISFGDFDDPDRVVLGSQDKYAPLCRSCYFKRIGGQ